MKARVVPASELPLDATHRRGVFTFTVTSALEHRRATGLEVHDFGAYAIASARTPHGELQVLGNADPRYGITAVYDAVTRLATLATRREGRDD
jgi:hypothetical protein